MTTADRPQGIRGMSWPQLLAMAIGVVYALIGIAGFFVTGFDDFFGHTGDELLGFELNGLHNVVHLAFGVWGLAAYRTLSAARWYARSVAVIYAIFAIMGLIPLLNTTFGLIPLYGHDVWLHVLLAVVAAYFGWTSVRPDEVAVGAPTTSVRTSRGL